MNELALCAGVGGMSLGVGLAVPSHRVACYVEREAYAAEVLATRMEEGHLPVAPIYGDIQTFDGTALRGIAPLIVTSGLPCQPYSVAGQQRGHEDDRALWPHFVRVVEECEAGAVFIENVPAFRKHFAPVWGRLRELGFQWAPPLLATASESGAPHIRERFFALAAHPERIHLRIEPGRVGGSDWPGLAGARDDGKANPDSRESGLEGWGVSRRGRPDECAPRSVGDTPAVGDGRRFEGEWCGWVFDGERETLRHDTNRCGDRCRIRGTLWDSESPPVRMASRTPNWVDELRAVGNVGCPPVVYARAFRELAQRLG